jgi:hypothetical protein
MGREEKDLRRVLGTLAGGILGASTSGKRHPKHPGWGALADAFVGGVGGLFAADGLNVLIHGREGASTEHQSGRSGSVRGEEGSSAGEDLEHRLEEIKAYALGVASASAFWSALVDTMPIEALKDEMPDADMVRLLREKRKVFGALFESNFRKGYKGFLEKVRLRIKREEGVDVDLGGDSSQLEVMLQHMEMTMDKRLAAG